MGPGPFYPDHAAGFDYVAKGMGPGPFLSDSATGFNYGAKVVDYHGAWSRDKVGEGMLPRQ